MADYLTNDTDLQAVADAIRAKGGTSAPLVYPSGFVSAIQASGGKELVSLTVTASGPTAGNPTIWYCSADGVKQMEKYKTPVQCLKNSAIIAAAGGLTLFTGLIQIEDLGGGVHIYQITDNATATHGY